MTGADVSKITGRRVEYLWLKGNPDYRDVEFDENNGGLKATHIGHNFDKIGGVYEKHAQSAGFKAGDSVIFGDERLSSGRGPKAEGRWNGELFEAAGCETYTSNNILRALQHCASKRSAKIVVIDFPNGGFDVGVLGRSIARYKGREKLKNVRFVKFDRIICVQNEEIVYDEKF